MNPREVILAGVMPDDAAIVALPPGLSVWGFGFAVAAEEDVVLG